MPGRGRQTFNKRQKEQQRKEKQQEKVAKRLQRKLEGPKPDSDDMPEDQLLDQPELAPEPDEPTVDGTT